MCLESIAWCNNAHFVLEILYFLSGISVAIGVVYSIRQYMLSRKDVTLKYSREVNAVTTDQLKMFYTEIVPLYEEMENKGVKFFYFDEKVTIVKFDNAEILESAKKYYDSLSDQDYYCEKAKKILINIQLMSANFEFGCADEKMVKEIILDKFLCVFEAVFPLLTRENDTRLYQSCVDLYNAWRVEKKTKQIKSENEKLIEATEEIKSFKVNK